MFISHFFELNVLINNSYYKSFEFEKIYENLFSTKQLDINIENFKVLMKNI